MAIYGTIDEANAAIGVVRMEFNREASWPFSMEADEMLLRIQQELFDVGAECACPPGGIPEQMSIIGTEEGERLVTEMNSMLEDLEPLSSFILPTGSPSVAHLHIARTVVRRAEREACAMRDEVRPEVISYLNRLSDHCFVLGRWITAKMGDEESLWTPLGKRD